jgi:hypothetical protein
MDAYLCRTYIRTAKNGYFNYMHKNKAIFFILLMLINAITIVVYQYYSSNISMTLTKASTIKKLKFYMSSQLDTLRSSISTRALNSPRLRSTIDIVQLRNRSVKGSISQQERNDSILNRPIELSSLTLTKQKSLQRRSNTGKKPRKVKINQHVKKFKTNHKLIVTTLEPKKFCYVGRNGKIKTDSYSNRKNGIN